jgi:hypothetical protein
VWVVGLVVAFGTMSLLVQTQLMALGTFSMLLVPALSIWAGLGAAAMVSPRRAPGYALLIAGIVFAAFAVYMVLLQFRLGAGGGGLNPSSGGPNT